MENVKPKVRSSNLELFRIITMILIVAHHYVVNSGLLDRGGPIYSNVSSSRSLFLLIYGAWGKIGINCFMLITGYFLCKSNITARKYAKLLLQVMFYRIVIQVIFWITGYAPFTLPEFVKMFIPVTNVGVSFTNAILVFYLFIPFLNILIRNMSEKQHLKILALTGFTYVFMGTVPFFHVIMNYVSWFMVLYLISSYIRLYPKDVFSNQRVWSFMLFGSIFLSIVSVVVCAWISDKLGLEMVYYFVTDSNTFLAVVTALSAFMFFKNLDMRHSKFINKVAASTFAVLLIHAHSDTMRQWLWVDVLKNTEIFYSNFVYVHALVSVLAVYIICTVLDFVFKNIIEKPFFALWDKKWDTVLGAYSATKNKLKKHSKYSILK